MREKLSTIDTPTQARDAPGAPFADLTAGHAEPASCTRCVEELQAAGKSFDDAFANRDYATFISFFIDENTTGLGADGTMGLNREAWGRILREYFTEPTWTLTVTPVKTVVQQCLSGQILEVVRFDSAADSITFVHATCWLRRHDEWKVVLQTEAGPISDPSALITEGQTRRDEASLSPGRQTPDSAPGDPSRGAGRHYQL
jgi:hypothetical protein